MADEETGDPARSRPKAPPEWVHRLDRWIATYAVPFVYGARPDRRAPPDLHAATCSVVDLGAQPFLLTACHVADGALADLQGPGRHCLVGQVEIEFEASNVRRYPEVDIATMPLADRVVRELARDDYQPVLPPAWPPRPPKLEEAVVLAGYPGSWREVIAWDELDFRSFTLLSMTQIVRPTEFMTQIDAAFLMETRASLDELPALDLPGISGGPSFLIAEPDRALVVPQLCGIVRQGWNLGDGNLIVIHAPLGQMTETGEIR